MARWLRLDVPMALEMARREPGFVAHPNGTARPFEFSSGMYFGRTVTHGAPVQIMANEFTTRFRPNDTPSSDHEMAALLCGDMAHAE